MTATQKYKTARVPIVEITPEENEANARAHFDRWRETEDPRTFEFVVSLVGEAKVEAWIDG